MRNRVLIILSIALVSAFAGDVLAQSDVTNQAQVLWRIAFMGKAVSNELVNISTNQSHAADLRQYATSVLTNHDTAGTNSYAELESFIANWSITSEPTVSSNLISIMKQALEYGVSGFVQLEAYAANTNIPPDLRQVAERMIEKLE